MRIMGVDPGLAITGYGIIQKEASDFRPVTYACIRTAAGQDLGERLLFIFQNISAVIAEYSPGELAVEDLFFNTNAKSAFLVGQARGLVLLAAAQAGIPVYTYTPLQVKQGVVGYGRAEKGQVQEMIRIILKLEEKPRPDDAADALAIALCHGHYGRRHHLQEGR
jgi:crossover junction endodeoxyribonuclease RuvC